MKHTDKYTCPCCGYKTLNESAGHYDICLICFWEDCPIQREHVDADGGPNHVSLRQAQKNFKDFGACEKDMLKYTYKPSESDVRDPLWKALP